MIFDAKIDFRVNDTWQPVRAAIVRLSDIDRLLACNDPPDATIRIDLSKCDYMGPDAAALLARICLVAHSHNRPYRITLPEGPPPLRAFVQVSGLEDAVRTGNVVLQKHDLLQPVVPLHSLRRRPSMTPTR